mmetsp:Transcript_28348/g.74762  ORF Transcript_28348/g.74762 Transcript_28348/m.74762 type:complete len:200 (-) Transcript_28348:54-653(-)
MSVEIKQRTRELLTTAQAREIFLLKEARALRKRNAWSKTLGLRYGVSCKTIRDIWKGRTWLDATRDLWKGSEVPSRRKAVRHTEMKESSISMYDCCSTSECELMPHTYQIPGARWLPENPEVLAPQIWHHDIKSSGIALPNHTPTFLPPISALCGDLVYHNRINSASLDLLCQLCCTAEQLPLPSLGPTNSARSNCLYF